ncbi:MAG TPA: response regulator [Desulfomonilia bacterium]|nr:response regulator [Desulfomonilia bacterium]
MISSKQVLIVDDSQELANVIADFLSMYGYQVHTARDGYDALQCMNSQQIQIVVSDIHMPRMDGFTLMGEIKTRYPKVPIVLITGFSVNEAQKMAFERGANAFVAKPFKLKELKNVIESVSQEDKTTAPRR